MLESLVAPEPAGDPMSTQKWVRSSLRTLSDRLKEAGHALSPPTVSRLLRKLDYSLHVNSKQLEARSNHPDRDVQFAHIDEQIATNSGLAERTQLQIWMYTSSCSQHGGNPRKA